MKTGKTSIRLISILICLVLSISFNNLYARKKPVTFDSLYSFANVGDLQLSPDGKFLTFVSRESDAGTGRSTSTIWLMNLEDNKMEKISHNIHSAWHPRWVDGENIAFLAPIKGQGVQVNVFYTVNGDINQITHYPLGVRDFVWSPTGEGLAFVSPVYPENNSLEYYLKRKNREKQVEHSGKLYDKLLFRPYNHWDDGTVNHVFYYHFKDKTITDITPGKHNAPASFLGGSQDIAFSPDGKTAAFTMNTDPVQATSTNNDVFTVNLDGENRERISISKGCDVDPRFSPDGKFMFYLEMARAGYEADQQDIILIHLESDKRRNLTREFDRTLREVKWSPDSKYIYFTCGDKGYRSFYQIETLTGKIVKLLGDVFFSGAQIDPKREYIYMIKTEFDRPGEIFKYHIKRKRFMQLTRFSDEFVKTYQLSKSEVFWYTGANNDPVQGFINFPPGYDKTKKYPMIMLFHGGPEGAWGANYSSYGGNPHLVAAQGYIVTKINIHGANTYGLAFQEAILGNWGTVDVEDVLKGLDYLIKTYPAIDGDRVGAMGRSYGGFLVNMLNGKTDRFKCFVSVDGIFDQFMNYYATDELWFPISEFKGTPETSYEIYKRSSPMTYSKNFKTPTLVIHGGRDYRVDPAQGVAMFTALQSKGIPSQYLFFPDEPHYYRKISTWRYVYKTRFQWFKKWLK